MRVLGELLSIFFGMSGLRLDRYKSGARFVFLAVAWALVLLIHSLLFWDGTNKQGALIYVGIVWAIYYLGNSLLLGYAPIKNWMIDRWGADRAYFNYEAVIGIVYLNQGLCQSALVETTLNTFPDEIPIWTTQALGIGFFAFGLISKWWATYLTGLDKYYYRDMFMGRDIYAEKEVSFVVSGPYKYFNNPMYGVGYLHAYGVAIFCRSWEYLLCSAIFHASIWLFYFAFEKEFVRKTYLAPTLGTEQITP